MSSRITGPSLIAGILFTLMSYLIFSFIYLNFSYNEWYWSGKILFIIFEVFILVQMLEISTKDNSKDD